MFFGAQTLITQVAQAYVLLFPTQISHKLTQIFTSTINKAKDQHHRLRFNDAIITLSSLSSTSTIIMTATPNATDKENAARRLKEKKAAEKALDLVVADNTKKREEEKKRRAEAKAKEEAEEKKKRDEERRKEKEKNATVVGATMNEAPGTGINAILTELSTAPGVEEGEVKEVPAIDLREAEDSPEKKKKKQATPATTSNLKAGRYSAQPPKVSPPTRPPHNYVHSRIIVDAAITLNKADPITSFADGLCTLFYNAKMVDEHFTIAPIKDSPNPTFWYSSSDIPTNMTAVSSHISISANNIRNFEKRNWEGSGKKEKDEPSSTVYFAFAICCDVAPAMLLARVGIEWTRAGGTRLMIKSLPCFDTVSPLVFYYLFNDTHPDTLREEFKKILTLTQNLCMDDFADMSDASVVLSDLPEMTFRKMIPKIPGQDTSSLKHLSNRAQFARRAWHLELEASSAEWLKELTDKAKHYGCFELFWGKHVHVTEITTKDTSAVELKRLAATVNRHTNYQCSLTVELLKGVVNVDAPTKYVTVNADGSKAESEFTLREILLKYFKMSDGHSLVAEVHQRVVTSPVEVVIPSTEEAETMVAKMNRHFPAFIYYYLLDKGMDKKFAVDLVNNSCCPTLTVEIPNCKWDGEQMLVTSKEEIEEEEIYSKLESANWFKDEIGLSKDGMNKKKKYLDPTLLYDIDGDRSIKTLHERNDKHHRGKYDKEGQEEEEDIMSTDSASDSDSSKSHHDTALGNAGDSTKKGVSFAAGSSTELNPGRNDAAGSG